jgi:hypothetical protein
MDIHASQDTRVADLVRVGQVRIGMFPPHYIRNVTTRELEGWGSISLTRWQHASGSTQG